MSEVSQLQRLANALKGYKGSRLSAYVDALPEMVASGASGVVGAVPGVVAAIEKDGPLTEKAQAFLASQEANSFDPTLDPRVLADLDAATPEVAKKAMLGYDEWAKENPTAALIPEIAASTFGRALRAPVKVEWDQLRGHEKEAEIRRTGLWPLGDGQYARWDPVMVNERGIPKSFTLSDKPNIDLGGEDGFNYTTLDVNHNPVGLPPYGKVGLAFNRTGDEGSGQGGLRYDKARKMLFGNDYGMSSSSSNSVYSTGAWEAMANKDYKNPSPKASHFTNLNTTQQHFLQDLRDPDPRFSATYMTNSDIKPNFMQFKPGSTVESLGLDPSKYAPNRGMPKGPNGERATIAVTHSEPTRFDPATGFAYRKPFYGTAEEAVEQGRGTPSRSFTAYTPEQRARALADSARATVRSTPAPTYRPPVPYTVSPDRVGDLSNPPVGIPGRDVPRRAPAASTAGPEFRGNAPAAAPADRSAAMVQVLRDRGALPPAREPTVVQQMINENTPQMSQRERDALDLAAFHRLEDTKGRGLTLSEYNDLARDAERRGVPVETTLEERRAQIIRGSSRPKNANNPETIERLAREYEASLTGAADFDTPLPKMEVEELSDKLANSRAVKQELRTDNRQLQERDMNQRRVIRDKRDILAAQNRVISNKRGIIEALREKLTREQGRSGAISRGQAERESTRERMLELGRTPEQADIASDSAKYRFLRNEGYPEQADEFRRRILGLPRYQR